MKNTSENIIASFCMAIYEDGIAPSTVDAYRKDLHCYQEWYMSTYQREPEPSDITSIDLREYQAFMQNVRLLKPATINRKMAALEKYLKWLHSTVLIIRQPSIPKRIREQQAPPKALDRNEQNRLMREVERRAKSRDIALLRLMMSCGLRVSEVVAIRITDLALSERQGLVNVRGKGNKYREVPVPPEARKAVRQWLDERDKKFSGNEWLFPGRSGFRISSRYAEQVVKKIGRLAGLDIHPHILRHTAATNMLRTGADLVTVAQVLGHSNLNTTAIYTKPGTRTMAEALERSEI